VFMSENSNIPFADVLHELFTADPLPLSLLYRLSDLTGDEFAEFTRRWPGVYRRAPVMIMRGKMAAGKISPRCWRV